MLQTVEVVIDVNGAVHWSEPLTITKPTRALLTLLEDGARPTEAKTQGNAGALLALLHSPAFANRPSSPAEEIEAQIRENRESWE